jgi:NADPH:quinone reductase
MQAAHMRVVEIAAPGGPENLRVAQRPRPVPGPGEVLIQVAAAGVNRPDVMQRKGAYPPPAGASDIPGLEVGGVVAARGEGVSGFADGDHVCALVSGGGYAEYCVAPAAQCLPVPAGLTDIEAASLPETYFTVWSNVFDRAALRPGESLLVQGGSSGIGVAAIQLAHAMGSRVFATAGSAEKCAACERLGAQRAINYRTEDFAAVVKAQTGGRGVDVILDMVGGEYLARETSALAEDGRLVFINTMGGAKTTINLLEVMVKRLTVTGSTLRARPVAVKGEIARRLQQHVWPLFELGKLRPVIYRCFPFSEAPAAHALMESSEHVGKIMLVP